jgi:hypothetical protein
VFSEPTVGPEVIGGAGRAPGATSGFGSQAAIRRRWRCNAWRGSRDGAPQPRWLATSVVARALVASFSTAALDLENLAAMDVLWDRRSGSLSSSGSGGDLERERLDRRCSGATSGLPLAERCGGRLAIPRPASWPEPPRVADTRTRVPERSARAGQGAARPRRPPGPWGWGLRRRGFKAIHGPAVAEWGTLSVEEAPRRSCHPLRCHGAVVRRSARRLDILKGLAGPVEHR